MSVWLPISWPVARDAARQVGELLGVAADQEERRLDVAVGERIEQQRRLDRIRAVVERQRDELRRAAPVGRRMIVEEAVEPRIEIERDRAVDVHVARDDRGNHRLARVARRHGSAAYASTDADERGHVSGAGRDSFVAALALCGFCVVVAPDDHRDIADLRWRRSSPN